VSLLRTFDSTAIGPWGRFATAALEDRDGARALLEPLRWVDPRAPLDGAVARANVDRSALAAALGAANASYGHPRASELAASLAAPRSRVVVTGQQPGLLGGPLLTVHKAISAVKWAAALSEATGEPAVAVFWMATEDHDWAEMTQGAWLTDQGPQRFDLGADPAPLAPVGTRTLGPALGPLLDRLRDGQPNDWTRQRLEQVAASYRPDARFGEAFARLLVRLLGDRCPLILDAMLTEVKTAQRPLLRRLVESRGAVQEALEGATRRLAGRGFEPQVPSSGAEASPLFLQRGSQRRRVLWHGLDRDGFTLRGGEGPTAVARLLEAIEENPSVVSAGVLGRAVVQDAILGTDLQVLGGAELAYMAQVAPLYDLLGVRAPRVALRSQALTLDAGLAARVEGWLERLPELLERGGDGLLAADGAHSTSLAAARGALEAALAAVRDPALAVDASLERPWEKTRDSALRSFDQFGAKLREAVARRDAVSFERVRKLRDTARPFGAGQERTLTVAPAAARWGEEWIGDLFRHLPLDPARSIVIAPREGHEEATG
jgi:bacillithiol biosynthesis cysteine-adding enzyme BshC